MKERREGKNKREAPHPFHRSNSIAVYISAAVLIFYYVVFTLNAQ